MLRKVPAKIATVMSMPAALPAQVSRLLLLPMLALVPFISPVANAAPIVFDFEAEATDVDTTEFFRTFPGVASSPTVGDLGIGGVLAGSFSVSDQLIDDASVGGDTDTFSRSAEIGSLFQQPDPALLDFGFSWQFGNRTAGIADASHPSNSQIVRLILTDSPQGDSISISLFRGNGVRGTQRTLAITLTDTTGTFFPGTAGLTGSYAEAVNVLENLDLGLFPDATVSVGTITGRVDSTNETVAANLTGFSIRSVPEPGSLAMLMFGLLLARFARGKGSCETAPSIA